MLFEKRLIEKYSCVCFYTLDEYSKSTCIFDALKVVYTEFTLITM